MKLPKAYQPSEYESDIYALWEKSGAFKPSGTGKRYSLVIPPPNANGNLHLGHDRLVIFALQVPYEFHLFLWDYEGVARLDGVDIKKGYGSGVFVNFLAGNLAPDDFREDAVSHVDSLHELK